MVPHFGILNTSIRYEIFVLPRENERASKLVFEYEISRNFFFSWKNFGSQEIPGEEKKMLNPKKIAPFFMLKVTNLEKDLTM